MKDDIAKLKDFYDTSHRIVFFGGAGVSTESGIPDFRSTGGLFRTKYAHPPEVMLSHSFFMRHPDEFFRFYRDKMVHEGAQPNAAHVALAAMESAGKLTAVITQNVDGLHQKSGSRNVIELHGSIHRNFCMRCRKPHGLDFILQAEDVPRCECGGIIKPDVVLYEEGLDDADIINAVQHIAAADMLIIGGTSLAVYPAAGLVDYYTGHRLVVINKGETHIDRRANVAINDSIGQVLGSIVK